MRRRAGYLNGAIAVAPIGTAVFGQHHPSDRGEILTLAEGAIAAHIDVVLPRTSAIVGRVVDAFGGSGIDFDVMVQVP